MFSFNAILAWVNLHIYPLFRTTKSVVNHLIVQEIGLDMTPVYKYWEEYWSRLEIVTPPNYNYPGTDIALNLSCAYQHAFLPRPNIYGILHRASGSVARSLTLGYVYLFLLAVAMVAACFIPRPSSNKSRSREDTKRFFLDAIKIAVDTTLSAFLPASFESIFREVLTSDMLRQLIPRAAGFLPAKANVSNCPFSVIVLGVVFTVVRIFIKSLQDKITLMDDEMKMLKQELERRNRREARIAYRNRITFKSWKRTALYRWKRTTMKKVVPRSGSSIEKEITPSVAAAISRHVILNLFKNTPWTPASQLPLITRTSATESRINRLLQLHTALVWYRYISNNQTIPAIPPLVPASSTSERLAVETKGPAKDQKLPTTSKPDAASPVVPEVPKQAAASVARPPVAPAASTPDVEPSVTKKTVDPIVSESLAATPAINTPVVPTSTGPAPPTPACIPPVVAADPKSVVELPVSKPPVLPANPEPVAASPASKSPVGPTTTEPAPASSASKLPVVPAISKPAVNSRVSQPLVVPAIPKITRPIVPVVPKQVVASPASKPFAFPATPVAPNRDTASSPSKPFAFPAAAAFPGPYVASPFPKPPIAPQKGLAAWGGFHNTDRQAKEEEQKRFNQAKAVREAEEARTGVRHEPQQFHFNESWKKVKVGDDNERRIVAVHKDPVGSSTSNLKVGDGEKPVTTEPTPAPAVPTSSFATPRSTTPAPVSTNRIPASTPFTQADEAKDSNTAAKTPSVPVKAPIPMRARPREVPSSVIAGTQRSEPSTFFTRSRLPTAGGQSTSMGPFFVPGTPNPYSSPLLPSNTRIPIPGAPTPTNAAWSSNPPFRARPNDWAQEPVQQVCKNWRKGHCQWGDQCRYMHPLYLLPPCRDFNSREGCIRDDCKFPHVLNDGHN